VHTNSKKPEENVYGRKNPASRVLFLTNAKTCRGTNTHSRRRVMLAVLAQEKGEWSRVVGGGVGFDIFCFWVFPDVVFISPHAVLRFHLPLVNRRGDLRASGFGQGFMRSPTKSHVLFGCVDWDNWRAICAQALPVRVAD